MSKGMKVEDRKFKYEYLGRVVEKLPYSFVENVAMYIKLLKMKYGKSKQQNYKS